MQFRKIFLASLITLPLIYGCSSVDTKKIFYKTGKEAYILNCTGASWLDCLQQASDICKNNGYDINERASSKISGVFSTSDYREMIITCKDPASSTPTVAPKANTDEASTPQEKSPTEPSPVDPIKPDAKL